MRNSNGMERIEMKKKMKNEADSDCGYLHIFIKNEATAKRKIHSYGSIRLNFWKDRK